MAKAKEIEGLDCSDDAIESAAKVLRARFDEMVEFADAALDFSDIEGVHDMRVAMRRLRSALRDFSLLVNKTKIRPMKKELKQISDALGAVRDEDVAIAALEKLESEIKNKQIKRGIGKFLEERRAVQEKAQIALTEILAEEKTKELKTQFAATIRVAFKKRRAAKDFSFKQAGQDVITANLREFCDLSDKIYEPFNGKALHKLRILAKRLRYAIQLFDVCHNDEIKSFAKEISKMQTFLGEIHDLDEQIERLSRRQCETEADKNERRAAEWLLSKFLRERNENYRGSLWLWSEWKASDFIEHLRTAIL